MENSIRKEDFEQSGKLRSEYRSFLYKYIVGIISSLVSLIGLYNYLTKPDVINHVINNDLVFGAIVLSFGAYLGLLIAVNFYTDQLLIATHHIRNQESHRNKDAEFGGLVALRGLRLFTRLRSIGNTARYFIPHWTSRNEFLLVISMVVGAFIPIFFTYFFWVAIYDQYKAIGFFLIELLIAIWIFNRKLLDIFSPLILSRVIIPDNPVPVMEKTPMSYLPLSDYLRLRTEKRTRLFWMSLLCLFVSASANELFLHKPISSTEFVGFLTRNYSISVNSGVAIFLYNILDVLIPSLPYSAMFFFIIMLNRYLFDKDYYRQNSVSFFVTGIN